MQSAQRRDKIECVGEKERERVRAHGGSICGRHVRSRSICESVAEVTSGLTRAINREARSRPLLINESDRKRRLAGGKGSRARLESMNEAVARRIATQ